ncbi:MAG: alkaline phosphatase family protein [Acidobacteriia bacterium]|nr:alkaline phosphatase family protein [Terriglobia bacterium]
MAEDALIALSFANLCFLKAWGQLQNPAQSYYRSGPPTFASLAAIALAVLLIAFTVFVPAVLIRRFASRKSQQIWGVLACVLLLLPANILSTHFLGVSLESMAGNFMGHNLLLGVVAGVLICLVVLRWRRPILRVVRGILLAASPLVLIFSPIACWQVVRARSLWSEPNASAHFLAHPAGPRVLWVLFDEMDEDLTFTARPSWLSLPELDRLRAESVYAAHAMSPGPATVSSIPSLITGHLVSDAQPAGYRELRITYQDAGRTRSWIEEPSIFSSVRERGLNAAIAGWYHPYGRLFGKFLAQCSWQQCVCATPFLVAENYSRRRGVWMGALGLVGRQAALFPLVQRLGVLHVGEGTAQDWEAAREQQLGDYVEIRKAAHEMIADPRLDLVFLHWPIPHPLGIFDRASGKLGTGTRSNYLDNLQLVDITIGEIRRALENSGMWENTTVLVSSDHPLRGFWQQELAWDREEAAVVSRSNSGSVPFLLKLAGQKQGLVYNGRFNAVITHDLILGVLDGKLKSPEQIVSFIDRTAAN